MPNGARHILGAAIGLILTPVIAAGLMFGSERLLRGFQTFRFAESDYRIGALVLGGTAVLLGLLVGSRISPLASLIPGLTFSTIGVLWALTPQWIVERGNDLLPRTLERGYMVIAPYGVLLVLGVLLLVASLFPTRWAPRQPAGSGGSSYEASPLPYGQNPAAGQGQPGAGQRPAPYVPGSPAPAYSPPPASGHQLPRSGSEHEGGAGGWTQMYGSGGSGRSE